MNLTKDTTDQFFSLGSKMAKTLTAAPLQEAQKLWKRLATEECEAAKAAFYSGADSVKSN